MTPTDLRALLARAGLSQRAAARELHIDPRTMRRYCAGQLPVPRAIELALGFIVGSKRGQYENNACTPVLTPATVRST